MRGTLPATAAGFLCVAGIADLRVWTRSANDGAGLHDALGYMIAALACALAAARGGAGLVHPAIAAALWPCAIACASFACKYRDRRSIRLRIAPAIMLAGVILCAPPPQYHATETSLDQAFAGEPMDFTGLATQTGSATTLVRFAITCCRADAAPVVVRLERSAPWLRGWIRAQGVLVQAPDGLRLHVRRIERIAPPADPFVYR